MELFSEFYSCYYQVVHCILESAKTNPLSINEMRNISEKYAFLESSIYIIPKLINNEWNLMEEDSNRYISKIDNIYKFPLTRLQKSWIKSILLDKRIQLFLEKEQIKNFLKILDNVNPLYKENDFYYFDRYLNGDNYLNEKYIYIFKFVFEALQKKEVIKIKYLSPKSGEKFNTFRPLKMEYSQKEDLFRVYCARINNSKIQGYAIINIGRILEVEMSNEVYKNEINIKDYFLHNKKDKPVVIQIFNERNALERCMLHFASFKKQTEYIPENNTYLCYIYYDENDELELLIRILSFGPVIKVLSPESFLNLIRKKLTEQKKLFDKIL